MLQFDTWNIVGSLAYAQSPRAKFNPKDRGQAHYPFWLEFPTFPIDMCPFVNLLSQRFGKVLISNGRCNSFPVNSRVHVDLKRKLPHFIYVCTINKFWQQKVRYLNLPNVYFTCHTKGFPHCRPWPSEAATPTMLLRSCG
jgi:hypothetical protein